MMQSQLATMSVEPAATSSAWDTLIKYLFVAIIALTADLGALSILVRAFYMPLAWAAVLAFIAGAAVNYCLSVIFVFRKRKMKDDLVREFFVFFFIGILGLLVTQGVLYVGVNMLHINLELTKIAAAGLTFFFNFGARKIILFS